jgi:hypothetical protein
MVEIPHDIDDDLIPPQIPHLLRAEGSRSPEPLLCTDQASHVLLAACGSLEKAWEENGKGAFTVLLINTMKEYGVNRITYKTLIDALPKLP